jgi:lycopene beta-cyclase
MSQMSHWPYLPFLLVWALPVIAIQWALGARYLWRERYVWPWVALGLTVWLTLADAIAIGAGVWRFDARALVGVALGPVPLEEILFYLLTALMITQGFVALWYGYADRAALSARVRARLERARRALRLADAGDGR